ncbi:ATP-dependent DNA helicase DinG [Alkalicoccus halolimnae]|uniref:3'-5' exonuclease DinG n=1 Tax=Alkalicoccus halolimnae TaxID=1667239 RepID=A0A5C7F4E0_9BACI|nr:ATP-dependent DNA helicase DinG [Alkalicoccus halolimnae]TXF82976.1 ATP-dependent DNA helicase DinG [Alkalicoccus halolimnae]
MPRFIVLDLETTGVSYKDGDRIIELAYAVLENNQIVKTYSSFVQTERKIPLFVQQLTSIDPEDVRDAPLFADIVPALLEDMNDAYFVAHNADFDLNFLNETLEEAGYETFSGPVVDTVELSRLAFPTENSFRLSELADKLQLTHNNPHRAESDALAAAELLKEIFSVMENLPPAALKQLLGLQRLFKSDVRELLEYFYENSSDAPDKYETYRDISLKLPNKTSEKGEDISINFSELLEGFKDVDKMKQILPDYVRRPGQEEMMNFVNETFEKNSIGLIEAGTGTGKTLAYLVPAAYYAGSEGKRVVISTETIQLQEQLLKQELPLAESLLPFPVRKALLKGRSHYICLQKTEQMLADNFQDAYERSISKAQLVVWLTQTETGDLEELNLADPSDRFHREIASDGVSCASPDCPWFSRCFYQRAKKTARHADIVITNHALLLTDIVHDNQVLPGYETVIIDEAHHLEEAATRQFGTSLDYASMAQMMNEFTTKDQDNMLENWLSDQIPEKWNVCKQQLHECREEWNDLFLTLYDYANKRGGRGETGDISKTIVHDKEWEKVLDTADRFHYKFRDTAHVMAEIQFDAESKWEQEGHYKRERAALDRYIEEISKLHQQFRDLILEQKENHVYWLERSLKGPKQSITLSGSPTDVSELLADRFFQKKKRAVLTSATLTVNQSFKYMIRQLGLEDFEVYTKLVASPFNWSEQVAFMVPDDIPHIQEDGEDAYIDAITYAIYEIAQISDGKMLVLFTSYDMLKKTYHFLQTMLDEEYMLIGQGVQSKSRTKLVKMFQQFERTILFGTSSFWEGVDIPGDDLSVIVMARLPFSPPNDPIFKAKSEQVKAAGGSPFMSLALPQAVLRFKQGFGRLIRRETDRGVVVVLDRRIETAKYGKHFIRSLPDIPLRSGSMYDLGIQIDEWLHQNGKGGV